MSFVAQTESKRLVAVHGWSGAVMGLFLYLVLLTGSVAVFHHEIGIWSAGGERSTQPLAAPIDDLLRELVDDLDPSYHEEVVAFGNAGGNIVLFAHTHAENPEGQLDDKGVRFLIDPVSREVLKREEGFRSDMSQDEQSYLGDFIAELHINLHLPRTLGLFATGILGLVMMSAVISGIILHKHLIKNIFTAPRASNSPLLNKDKHVLAGSWSLPFGFLLAFTGTFFSFAGALALPVVAMVAFGGDQELMIENLLGSKAPENPTPAALTNIDELLADFHTRAGSAPESIVVSHWGRADAEVTLFNAPREGSLTGVNYAYSGVSGEFQRVKPLLGQEESFGGNLVSLMVPLHFGNFGGILSKVVWFSLGIAACYVTLTGLQLWATRRKHEPAWRFLPKTISAFGYGVPVSLVGAALGYFIGSASEFGAMSGTWLGFSFSAALVLFTALWVKELPRLSSALTYILITGMLVLPLARDLSGGPGWPDLIASGDLTVVLFDLTLILGACSFVIIRSKREGLLGHLLKREAATA